MACVTGSHAHARQVGEIDIDSELVAASQKLDGKEETRIMMLNNGCLCCTVRDDLADMLTELVSGSGFRVYDTLWTCSPSW
jgi:G3E family GTPase